MPRARVNALSQKRPSLAVCPALCALASFLPGVLCVSGPVLFQWSPAVPIIVLGGWAGLIACSPAARRWGWMLLLAVALSGWHIVAPRQTYRRVVPRAVCGAEVKGIAMGTAYTGTALSWLMEERRLLARITHIRLGSEEDWQRCTGKVLVLAPEGAELAYGTRFETSGAFLLPQRAPFPGAFDYRRYLLTRGIKHIFRADTIAPTGTCDDAWIRLHAALLSVRDACADALAAHIGDRSSLEVLLAMTLGYRQGLSREVRADFIRSGTIHLFAVSGLHVAILGSIALMLMKLCFVPFRSRSLALPLLLGVYVLLTGAPPSAVRAWLMASVWSLSRVAAIPPVPINTVAFAALLILIGNPLAIGQTGFVFSFAVVSVLVLGWCHVARVSAAWRERAHWVPAGTSRMGDLVQGAMRQNFTLFGGSVLAWLGSMGLVAYTNGLIIPSSILVNGAISLVAWLTLLVSVLKVGCAWVPGGFPDALLGEVLGWLLRGIHSLAAAGGKGYGSIAIPCPSAGVVLFYYLFLVGALLPVQRCLWRHACTVATVLAGAAILVVGTDSGGHLITVSGNGCACPAQVLLPARRGLAPVVVDAGKWQSGRIVGEWLRRNGWDVIDALVFTGTDYDRGSGASVLAQSLPPRTLVLPKRRPWGNAVTRLVNDYQFGGGRVRLYTRDERRYAAVPPPAGEVTPELAVASWTDGRGESVATVRLCRNGGVQRTTLRTERSGYAVINYLGAAGAEQSLCLPRSLEIRIHDFAPTGDVSVMSVASEVDLPEGGGILGGLRPSDGPPSSSAGP